MPWLTVISYLFLEIAYLSPRALWHTFAMSLYHSAEIQQALQESLQAAESHYENFPVASFLLPQRLRAPISLIYQFARQADDLADEGVEIPETRLANLNLFREELELIQGYIKPDSLFFQVLGEMIREENLPMQPFFDLLDAFSQDVVKSRYANQAELMEYCQHSANPVGRLLLHLYDAATEDNLRCSDAICSALQLINFWQDVGIDIDKGRVYLPDDERQHFQVTDAMLYAKVATPQFKAMLVCKLNEAETLMRSGASLGNRLPGRIGLEMRAIIAGGLTVLNKIRKVDYDVFRHRPVLTKADGVILLSKAILRRHAV